MFRPNQGEAFLHCQVVVVSVVIPEDDFQPVVLLMLVQACHSGRRHLDM